MPLVGRSARGFAVNARFVHDVYSLGDDRYRMAMAQLWSGIGGNTIAAGGVNAEPFLSMREHFAATIQAPLKLNGLLTTVRQKNSPKKKRSCAPPCLPFLTP